MTRYEVVFTPRAFANLDNLFSYIAETSGIAPEDFVGKIVADCLSLSGAKTTVAIHGVFYRGQYVRQMLDPDD